ncbi:uncharacterized protein I206_104611 [Kwoniella pini CBS 10737]|uniref:Protein CPL1-like domain-containing protein n=1 Tax=Kwoniella pini CBS 10737 TaxID=1296096 RepID=A0A1B9I7K2_9TREE|nr:uncharacterized protein I206_02145 [Kwoniella pini CBS 10737]OCF51431.1 hypothetical protein I206_02145 [Kwoniella pini CBS 10737]
MLPLTFASISLLTISALLYAQTVLADNTFAGCYSDDGVTFVTQLGTGGGEGSPANAAECSTTCGSSDYTYAAWRASDGACFCSNNFPTGPQMTSGQDYSGTCTTSSDFSVRVVTTSFNLLECTDSVSYDNDGFMPFVVVNPQDCFNNCRGAYIGTFIEAPQNGYYTCQCAADKLDSIGNEVTCSPSSYFIFYHTAAAKASGLSRRKSLPTDIVSQRYTQYCPSGLTACRIQGQEESYECLNTSTELESCGGCMFGQYGNTTSDAGEDCTTIGAALGASTCIRDVKRLAIEGNCK